METLVYIRTSTTEQEPQNQLNECLSINEWGPYEVFEDKQSAWKEHSERPGFNQVKKLIKSRQVNHLIVWDLDRLYRNRNNIVEFFRYCKAFNCQIHSYRQAWLNEINKAPNPWNEIIHDLLIQIMGWVAQDESDKKGERVKLAVRKKGNTTISYKGNKWGRKQLSTQKKNIIKEMRAEGKTFRQISEELNLSVGVVHKYTTQMQHEENEKIVVHNLNN